MFTQQVDALARRRGHMQTGRTRLFVAGGCFRQVDFVQDDADGDVLRQSCEFVVPGVVIESASCIDHIKNAIGASHFVVSAADAFGFDNVGVFAKACGIGDVQRHAVDVNSFAQDVASGAGNVSD